MTLACLERRGYETGGLRSKGWDELATAGAPELHFVFTVCDAARSEACPIWPGHPATSHWGVQDPAAFRGSHEATLEHFDEIYEVLAGRVKRFVALPLAELEREALARELDAIGNLPPASG